ncbi:zinc-binding domain-containing protein [Astrocystis sublimbata]|nr:zinc-binding domain-containing protein [Astrocystis sublimbata]
MAKKNIETSMHPSRHARVVELLSANNLAVDFYDEDTDNGVKESRETAVMGKFRCHNPKCESKGWGSKRIAMTIRMYDEQRYNAKVYHQRCKSCGLLGKPILDENTYEERVTYWLKKWNGIQVKRPNSSGGDENDKPHRKDLCVACERRCCPLGDSDE